MLKIKNCTSSDSQVGEFLGGPRQHGLVATHYDGPLNKFRMLNHEADQLIVLEIFVSHEFTIGGLVRAQRLVRLQAGPLEQLLQSIGRSK